MRSKCLLSTMLILLVLTTLSNAFSVNEKMQNTDPIFYVPFDGNIYPTVYGCPGTPQDQVGETADVDVFVEGIKGLALRVKKVGGDTMVKYWESSGGYYNLYPPQGTIEFWVRLQWDIENDWMKEGDLFVESGAYGSGPGIIIYVPGRQLYAGVTYLDQNNDPYWMSASPGIGWWNKGEWHQVVFTWKEYDKATVYIDGEWFSTFDLAGMSSIGSFYIGQRGYGLHGYGSLDIDELKIYNGLLSETEIRNHYIKLFPIECYAKETVFYTKWLGQQVKVDITNIGSDTIQGYFSSEVSGSQTKVWRQLQPGQAVTLTVPFGAEETGEYYLNCTFTPASEPGPAQWVSINVLNRTIRLFAIPSKEQPSKPETSTLEKDWDNGIHIDCYNNKIRYGLGTPSGPNVDCPYYETNGTEAYTFGYQYRRTGARYGDRFGYEFKVGANNLGKPHLVVVRYPALEDYQVLPPERTMEIDILEPYPYGYSFGPVIQTGVSTGCEYPCDWPNENNLKQQRIIFWPQTEKNLITIMNRWKDHRAACLDIWIWPIKGDETQGWFPKTNVISPNDGGRLLGLYFEEPVIYQNFGTPNQTIRGFYEALKHMIDYLHYTGQNLLVYPIYFGGVNHVSAPIYPSRVEPYLPYNGEKGPWHYQADWLELMLKMCKVNGIYVIPAFEMRNIPSFEHDGYPSEVLGIVSKVRDLFQEVLDEYGEYPAFKGISFRVWWDYNLRNCLNSRLKAMRCDIDKFLWEAPDSLNETIHAWGRDHGRPDLQLVVSVFNIYWSPQEWKTNAGLDLDDLQDKQHIRTDDILRFGHYRREGCPLDPFLRDFYTTPAYYTSCYGAWYKQDNTAATIHNPYYEDWPYVQYCKAVPSAQDQSGDWLEAWEDWKHELTYGFKRYTAITPGHRHFMEYYMLAMTNLDPIQIGNGGSSVGTVGYDVRLEDHSAGAPIEAYGLPIQNFAKSFRALPAKSFTTIPNDKVLVRDLTLEEPSSIDSITNYYFYLMNKKSCNVTATVTFNKASFDLIDLVTGDVIPVANAQYIVKLCPYELRSYRTEGTVEINNVIVQVVSPQHNAAVKYVTLPSREIYPGWNVTIKIGNTGHYNETVNVTAYLNDTMIGTHAMPLPSETDDEIEFIIPLETDLGDLKLYVNYTLRVEVNPVPGETILGDNLYIYGYIAIKKPGDVNCDRRVNILDMYPVAIAFGSSLGDPRYDVKADIVYDNTINIKDIYTVAKNFGWAFK